jgi:abortive infection bacteriophage resistance protein
MIAYTKPHATAIQRIAHLRAKGLVISRPNVAARKIEAIGYERLRIYFLSRRDTTLPGRPFHPGTTYQDIIRLYECDMKLRDSCFSAVGQFELLLRNSISETLSDAFGSHPYHDLGIYRDATASCEANASFLKIYSGSKDPRAKHYRQTYSDPALPPIWTMKEFLTFGAASYIFQRLEGGLRTKIAAQFGIRSDQVFTSWLECLVDLRNICAHHDRLFNRSFQKQPAMFRAASLPTAPTNKLKAILECLDHMMVHRGAPVHIVAKVDRVIRKFPTVRPAEAGY